MGTITLIFGPNAGERETKATRAVSSKSSAEILLAPAVSGGNIAQPNQDAVARSSVSDGSLLPSKEAVQFIERAHANPHFRNLMQSLADK